MIVCICRRVSDRDIARHAPACGDFDELQMETGVSTSCGRCRDCAQALFEHHGRVGGACELRCEGAVSMVLAA
ncbi:(2Fe-2S)-binding protein [Rivibacter subsaxonicus]|uniref:Bacterioferritin-associated ferredoxin n=1 Tax=Rivibacter subsaxonicus TaxID=457575 RepID=A0A4Q7VPG8_9BURK|nr:(2Fe-2S)-binding protein [Rivibacter subsaxonicus]RZT98028.1 bacterioferritin-associated ferredoxin [Rivibacter subsaxonicus]